MTSYGVDNRLYFGDGGGGYGGSGEFDYVRWTIGPFAPIPPPPPRGTLIAIH